MANRYMAYTTSKRESESNLSDIRVEKGILVWELCRAVGISTYQYYELVSGTVSPLYVKTGKVKDFVQKILDVLDTTFEDAFPRYACTLNKSETILYDQQFGTVMVDIDTKHNLKKIWRVIRDICMEDSPIQWKRLFQLLVFHFKKGMDYPDAGKIVGYTSKSTRTRAYDMFVLLRKPANALKLRELLYE